MEKFAESIANLNDEYMKKFDLPEESYIKEVLRIIVLHDELEDYAKSILIKRLTCYSYYNTVDGIIYFDFQTIKFI